MNGPAEPLRLVHHHPGRLRARANVFLDAGDDDPVVVEARATAAAAPISHFAHFPATGSILIEYAPGALDPDELLERIALNIGCAGVVHDNGNKHRDEVVDAVIDAFKGLNELAFESTGRRADLREIVPGALVLTSVAAFLSGGGGRGFMPRWEVALWFAHAFFTQWHSREIDRKRERASSPG
jgi:hypothetical protein